MRSIHALAFLLAAAAPLLSQGIIYTIPGSSISGSNIGDEFGKSVGTGNFNGDGFDDIVVGIPMFDPGSGTDAGKVAVYSGKNGTPLFEVDGSAAGDNFGWSVSCSVGDVDFDGYSEIVVGAPLHDTGGLDAGRAYVISGQSGATLFAFDGFAAGVHHGWSVSGAGDINLDGHPDILVGAPLHDTGGLDAGRAYVYSGKDSSTLHTFDGITAGDNFGWSVSCVGDINLDSYSDVAVGAPMASPSSLLNAGQAYVFWNLQGAAAFTSRDGFATGDNFGWSVSTGDTNGDAYPDLMVGAPCTDPSSINDAGSVYVYETVANLIPVPLTPTAQYDGLAVDDAFGRAICGIGDVDNDGDCDLIVGAPDDHVCVQEGRLFVISGSKRTLVADTHLLSVGVANSQIMTIDAGIANALKSYWLFTGFAASGSSPGVTMAPGVVIPLNQPDPLTSFVIGLTQLGGGAPVFAAWKGALTGVGKASPSLNTFGPTPAPLGITLHHAALVYTSNGCGAGCDTFQLATNWVPMTTAP